ncbi:MAG: prolyl oligopeptidase family serine peptidase [Bacteroidales bacterium]|nr:prolyl oligopeptidase family serine peptidase [Bacteroidales bacterium]
MKRIWIFLFAVVFVQLWSCQQSGFNYPVAEKVDQVDTYFGTDVSDPYRWLEDDNSEETMAWVKAQNEVTFSYLNAIPYKNKIKDRLTEIWDYEKVSTPWKEGGHYFISKNDGLQNQGVFYIMNDLDSEPELFLDPNKLSEDGTVALNAFSVSKDGKYLGYGISRAGSDWRELFVKNIETGEVLPDHIMWAKFSGISWFKDGFFYTRYPAPEDGDILKAENINSMVYYHKAGTSQELDKLVYKDADHPDWGYGINVTEDEKYIFLSVTESTSGNALYFKSLEDENADWIKLMDGFENNFSVIDHIDGKLIIMTDYKAPKYKIISVDPANPDPAEWNDLIPEKEDVLESITFGGGRIIAKYLKDARSNVEIYDIEGKYIHDVELPTIGSVGGIQAEKDENIAFFSFSSYNYPGVVFKYDINENKTSLYWEPTLDFDASQYETNQVFYESKDGTKIPMFIVHKKGLDLNGDNPTLLYGYGGFNISITPGFNVSRLIWLENGGVYAVANLRGGGEYGEEWHQAGTKLNKQNVFDDFIYAGKYLIDKGYTSSQKLCVQGGSNGGLLIGAVINQEPEMFKVAFPAVGVMDMLRYQDFTIGRYWAVDYGTSADSQEMFEYLYGYSPLHNIESGLKYPAVMVTTADHDDRVVPAHSFKYSATLQDKYNGKNPVMIRIETKAGHGGGKPTSKRIEEAADLYSFAFYNIGVTPKY